ncbi:MarR family winged helix-turn-helix transcriptional regulator [Allorhizobium undicola]|uniref:MarR family winged helix-turn-helix transcriptional regulator n=1 Tax=Allorhizobium undicola TaxID=78527 RepID=UPI003D32519C
MTKSIPPLPSVLPPAPLSVGAEEDRRQGILKRLGDDLGRLRLMMGRRLISRVALSRLGEGHGLELSHFDVVTFVARHQSRQAVTVGMVAEQMRVDPSRASRVVSELVKRGFLRREACQSDARRTIVRLSPEGEKLADYFASIRHEVVSRTLEEWDEAELALFEPLFDRFIAAFEQRAAGLERPLADPPD